MARKLKDARLGSKVRRDRSLDGTRAADSRVLDDQERLDEFRKSMHQSILPDLPPIKGYHVIWLTTQNRGDTLASRVRLGYEPIRPAEVPGFETLSMKSADFGNLIAVNEMVAFKLPLRLFQMYMEHNHHQAPLEEEQKLSNALETMKEQMARAAGGRKRIRIDVADGTEDIVTDRPAPKFRKMYGER